MTIRMFLIVAFAFVGLSCGGSSPLAPSEPKQPAAPVCTTVHHPTVCAWQWVLTPAGYLYEYVCTPAYDETVCK